MLKIAVKEVEENLHGGVGLVHITKGNLEKIKIPLPPLEIQQEIVTKIEGCQKHIDGCRELIVKYEEKIKKVVDGVWGE
jgi:restriction endonuclease S subunit